ncbi:MAG: PEP-CTERM sorting domain-containing protein [Phycisphaerae bacterium]|nr:PEP-CTERM sorting domain-containing protein [Phycisphaerae bacterium]
MKKMFLILVVLTLGIGNLSSAATVVWDDGLSHVIDTPTYNLYRVDSFLDVNPDPGTTVEIVEGGVTKHFYSGGNSVVTVNGGVISEGYYLLHGSHVNIHSGQLLGGLYSDDREEGLPTAGNSTISMSGGLIDGNVTLVNDTMTITGGTVGHFGVYSSELHVYGGTYAEPTYFQDDLFNIAGGDIYLYGEFDQGYGVFENVSVAHHYVYISGILADGSPIETYCHIAQGTGKLHLVPEPATLGLLSMGVLLISRKRN